MGTFNSTGSGGNWTDDSTWAETGQPAADGTDHVIITGGDTVTLTANTGTGSIKISGTIEGAGHTLTVSSAYSNKPFDNDGTIDSGSDLNVTITNTGTQQDGLFCDFNQASQGNINNLTINLANGTTANKTVICGGDTTIDGALTITSGTLDTSSSSNVDLTVTGDVSVTGTLTGNASAISMGSLTINSGGTYSATSGTTTLTKNNGSGYIMQSAGTSRFTHNNGTIKFDGSESVPSIDVDDPFKNVIIDTNNKLRVIDQKFDIAGDLTITSGGAFAHSSFPNTVIEVAGDVDIQAGTLGSTGCTADWEFGSLTIASGATYIAPSGTTTITDESSGGDAVSNAGTFTPNGGLLKITTDDNTVIKGNE